MEKYKTSGVLCLLTNNDIYLWSIRISLKTEFYIWHLYLDMK